MSLVLIDFDGTLTSKDSLFKFLLFCKKKVFYIYIILFIPTYILYLLGVISNHTAKEKLFKIFFKNTKKEQFTTLCINFAKYQIPKILNQNMLKKLQKHIENKDDIVIVSASIEDYLIPFAKELSKKSDANRDINVLATKLEFKNSLFTGNFKTKNCYGKEKVNRILENYTLSEYKKIYAYGDSEGDKEMFLLASDKFKVTTKDIKKFN